MNLLDLFTKDTLKVERPITSRCYPNAGEALVLVNETVFHVRSNPLYVPLSPFPCSGDKDPAEERGWFLFKQCQQVLEARSIVEVKAKHVLEYFQGQVDGLKAIVRCSGSFARDVSPVPFISFPEAPAPGEPVILAGVQAKAGVVVKLESDPSRVGLALFLSRVQLVRVA